MILPKSNFLKARDFLLTNARMIERRLFEFHFANGNMKGVFHAVYAYRNPDGGFGHGMEPDTASPESQPLFSIMALETLDEVGYLTQEIILNDFMPYFENITGDTILDPLSDYIQNYEVDGISMVEIEGYFNYKDDHTSSLSALDTNDLNAVTSVINTTLADLGLKSHLILNSSLDFFQNSSDVNKSDLDHLDNFKYSFGFIQRK